MQPSVFSGSNAFAGYIGADLTMKARYVEFHDGYIMTDGSFLDINSTRYSALYGSGAITSCFQLLAGDVSACSAPYVVCEKTLYGDTEICLDKNVLSSDVVLNASAELTVVNVSLSHCYNWQSSCIFYFST